MGRGVSCLCVVLCVIAAASLCPLAGALKVVMKDPVCTGALVIASLPAVGAAALVLIFSITGRKKHE